MRNTLFAATLVVTLFVGALGLPTPASARQDRVNAQIDMMEQTNGTLNEQSPEMTYTIDLYAGRMFSLQAWPISSDLQVEVVVTDPAGTQIAQSDVLDQASGLSAVESMITEQDGIYSVTVRRVGETAGDFSLIVLPGYGSLEVWDHFDGTGDLGLTWSSHSEDNLYQMGVVDEQYMIEIHDPRANWTIRPYEYFNWEDHYVEASIRFGEIPAAAYGFVIREIDDEQNRASGYIAYFNERGEWGVRYRPFEGDTVEISAKQFSPVIDVSDPNPRIGVLVEGYTFTLFFNGQVVGQATDTEKIQSSGEMALFSYARDEVPTQVYFDDLVITIPLTSADPSVGEGPDSLTGILEGAGVEENADAPFGIGQKLERDMLPAEERPLPIPAVVD